MKTTLFLVFRWQVTIEGEIMKGLPSLVLSSQLIVNT